MHQLDDNDPLVRAEKGEAHQVLTVGSMAKALSDSKQALSAMRGQVATIAKIAADIAAISERIAKLEARK
jgi:hypothetical protein